VRRLSYSLILATGLTATAAPHNAPSSIVGVLKDQGAIDGCSWSAEALAIGKGFFFLAEYDQSRVLMNLLGADVHLKRDTASTRGALKKLGETLREVYEGPGIRVEATYTAIGLCGPKDTECEDTKFKAVFEVHAGDREQKVVATGDVGC
jgi:hypothetical protein